MWLSALNGFWQVLLAGDIEAELAAPVVETVPVQRAGHPGKHRERRREVEDEMERGQQRMHR